jgi:hypothetical protein
MVLLVLALIVLLAAPSSYAIQLTTFLDGPSENPANASPGTGFSTVEFDPVAHLFSISVTFSDLVGTTTASHIHCCVAPPGNAGVATITPTFPGFPLGVSSGTYSMTFDTTLTSSFNAPFVTANGGTAAGAELALFNGLLAGEAYLNLHSTLFPAGEIRGFLEPVPEPATWLLLATGAASLLLYGRRRQRLR